MNMMVRRTVDTYISENNLDREEFYRKLNRESKKILRMMEKELDCGGNENPMTKTNFEVASAFFAFWDITDRKFTARELYALIKRSMPKSLPVAGFVSRNFNIIAKLLYTIIGPAAGEINSHIAKGEWKDAWGIDLKPLAKNSFSFDLIGCPLCKFAKNHGYMKMFPALCATDHLNTRLMGARLIRPEIAAMGCERCKFTYVPLKK